MSKTRFYVLALLAAVLAAAFGASLAVALYVGTEVWIGSMWIGVCSIDDPWYVAWPKIIRFLAQPSR